MNETIHTIAEKCGVSPSTVSRVLSGQAEKYRIGQATAQKVLKVAHDCNFVPNPLARSLSTKKSNTVGLLLPNLINPFFAEIAHIAVTELKSAGYTTILINTTEDSKSFEDSLQTLVSRKVDGIIAAPCGENASLLEKIDREKVPVVLIDRFYRNSALSFVTTDNYKGAVDAVKYLIDKGHRNIACINGVENATPVIERRRGYIDAMNNAGLRRYISVTGNDSTFENGFMEMRLLLGKKERPSAVFSLGNTITMGAIMALKESGIRIPEDMSLISFDNQMYLDFIEPKLARISQPTDQMTRLATRLLIDKMKNKDSESMQILLPPTLIEGKSVKNLR